MIDTVLFDMDGVIIDSEQYYISRDILWMHDLGYTHIQPKDLYKLIGTSAEVTYELTRELLNYEVEVEKIIELKSSYFRNDPMNYDEVGFKDSLDLIKFLKSKNIKIALCSSSSNEEITNALKSLNIYDEFDVILSGHDFKRPKPAPDIYLNALEKLNSTSDKAIVIEDSSHGIAAAKAANIKCIARRDKLYGIDQSKADMIIDDLRVLKNLFES